MDRNILNISGCGQTGKWQALATSRQRPDPYFYWKSPRQNWTGTKPYSRAPSEALLQDGQVGRGSDTPRSARGAGGARGPRGGPGETSVPRARAAAALRGEKRSRRPAREAAKAPPPPGPGVVPRVRGERSAGRLPPLRYWGTAPLPASNSQQLRGGRAGRVGGRESRRERPLSPLQPSRSPRREAAARPGPRPARLCRSYLAAGTAAAARGGLAVSISVGWPRCPPGRHYFIPGYKGGANPLEPTSGKGRDGRREPTPEPLAHSRRGSASPAPPPGDGSALHAVAIGKSTGTTLGFSYAPRLLPSWLEEREQMCQSSARGRRRLRRPSLVRLIAPTPSSSSSSGSSYPEPQPRGGEGKRGEAGGVRSFLLHYTPPEGARTE